MPKYHINSQGQVGPCRAEKGKCPFGEGVHYGSEAAAQNAFDRTMSKLTGQSKGRLTDKQYDVAKTVGMYTEVTATEIGKRGDLEEAKKLLDDPDITAVEVEALFKASDENGEIQSMLINSEKGSLPSFYGKDYNKGAEMGGSSPLINDRYLHRTLIGWGNDISDRDGFRGDMTPLNTLYKNAVLNNANQVSFEGALQILERSRKLNKPSGVNALMGRDISDSELQELHKRMPRELNKSLANADGELANRAYRATGDFNVNNPNLSEDVLVDIVNRTDLNDEHRTMRSWNYSVENENGAFNHVHPVEMINNHPNATPRVRSTLKTKYPEEYEVYFDYAGTGKPAREVQGELLTLESNKKLNTRGTYREEVYRVNKDVIKKYNLSDDKVESLLPVYNAGFEYDKENGVFITRVDSGD